MTLLQVDKDAAAAAQRARLLVDEEREGPAPLDGLLAEIGFNGYQWVLTHRFRSIPGILPKDRVSYAD